MLEPSDDRVAEIGEAPREETALTVSAPDARGGDEPSFGSQVGVFAALLLFTAGVVVPLGVMLWAAIVGAAGATGGTALVHTGGLESKTFGTALDAHQNWSTSARQN